MIIKRLRHEVRVYTKKAPWQKRDNGLTARIIVSFAILTILYLVFLSVLAYVGLGAIPIAVIAGIMILAQWYFSDKIVLWSTGAKIVSREQFPELHDLVERIVARNNLPKPRIAVINTKMPNAFATGKTPKSSIVTVTTGLMDQLETEELEGVIAHELSHIKNRDVLVLTLASLFSTIAWYLMQSSLYGGMYGGYGRRRDGGGGMLLVLLVAIITWFVSFLMIRAISRYREFVADRDGALMTGKPSKLASALLKISGTMKRIPTQDLRQMEGMNAFFIIPALSGSSFANLFSTHPPVDQRVKKLLEMEAAMS
ncbi:MAG: zinc metalloprotease HtpX [Thaumarchaeota archaeon 13_1_40CM_3_50_5]|nr:MAG: zinc metalloprotease HtpX [Candidatus Nitrososphaera sp. 13_1_40CM_48_12]OLC25649.1 MAG: zinc metalloprotease HtpX [Thaumarchaeota archaeon 13_1_40CM_4_48_7]OLC87293.1 MAG: zinc metalloprotease HtpX [Thaumarchaeota archaeon 13_1_40CM_3_50_5]